MTAEAVERLEIDLLFEAMHRRYGYDFRHYASSSAARRVMRRVAREGLSSVSELQHCVLHDESVAEALLRDLSINVTELFRDPEFYCALRDTVLPQLAAHVHLKFWHAGCATGEEVYSMAILLTEEGLYERSQLYATDFNPVALEAANSGVFPLARMRLYSSNYLQAGGKRSLSDYYHANYERTIMDEKLKQSILFTHHNLATDSSFGEMQVIICRNVLIYFDRELQERVLQLFDDSLCDAGFLCLGSHETLKLSGLADRYETVVDKQRIYRKIG